MRQQSFPKHRGLTLIELVTVIAILAIALVGVTAAISSAVSRSADVLLETRATALAQSYLDEILGRRFDEHSAPRGIPPCNNTCTAEADFGPDPGGTCGPLNDLECRRDYDDVDDYHGLDEGRDQTSPLRDSEGNERLEYENFRVQISVRYLRLDVDEPEENLGADADDLNNPQDAKLITVTVSHASRPNGWQYSVYKANF